MYVYCVYPAMSKKSENLSDLNKKDRNKHHSSPFINVVKGVFFVVCVTLVPVSYLSAPSAVHSYRVPGKFIRIVGIKQKFIHIACLYSKCTDCRIKAYIDFYFHIQPQMNTVPTWLFDTDLTVFPVTTIVPIII
jgi:hypothetical protein